ncbi:hypothetical protein Tco_1328252 [Tanacetum coccineum]
MVPQALLTKSGLVYVNSLKRLFQKKTPNYNRYFNRSVNSVKDTRVHTARPKTEVNTFKASASWVWKPKQEVIDHVSKSNNASKTLTRYDYVDAYGRFKTVINSPCYDNKELASPKQTATVENGFSPPWIIPFLDANGLTSPRVNGYLLSCYSPRLDTDFHNAVKEQDLYICVAEEDMDCTTSTPDIEVTFITKTEVREFNAKLKKKHVNQYNMVTSCSYDNLKKLYDELQKQFSDLDEQYNENYIQVQAYKSSLKTLEKQKKILLNDQLVFEDKIRVLSSKLENTTNLLKYSKKVNAEMSLEKQDLQAKLENERTINAKWKESSKNMDKLINSSMSSRSKFGLRFGETFGSDEVFDPSAPSIFDTTPEDVEGKPLYNRFVKTDRMKAVPPPLSGNYIPLSDPTDLDESQMTYGPKQTYTSDSEPKH